MVINLFSWIIWAKLDPSTLSSGKILGLRTLDYPGTVLGFRTAQSSTGKTLIVMFARVVTRPPRFCSVTPLLKSLHWFPVQFKICTLTYKVIHKCQPVYIHNLLKPLNKTRNLRSSNHDQLVVPRVSRHARSTKWNGKRTLITGLIRICSAPELGTPRI